jgi:hypothetical protein
MDRNNVSGIHHVPEVQKQLRAVTREGRRLVDIEITSNLGFVRDPRAILRFSAADAGVLDVFAVGMSEESLRKCRTALNAEQVNWRTTDGSLVVTGADDKVVLTFVPETPSLGRGASR